MLKLYYVRHGLTEMNVQGLFAGLTETPLTAEGRVQATAAGKLARNFKIDLIVCSPMQRAHDTARLIAAEIDYPDEKILLNKLLIERDFGPLEGTPWSPDLNLDGISDIETDNTLIERAHLAYNWLQTLEADNILVVSHGAFGRALRAAIRKQAALDKERLQNAHIVQFI